jgi:hypothetical protein
MCSMRPVIARSWGATVGRDAELTRFDDALAPDALRLNARAALLLEPAAQIFSAPAAVARIQALGTSHPGTRCPDPAVRRCSP